MYATNAQAFNILAKQHDQFTFSQVDVYTLRVWELLEEYIPTQRTHFLDLGSGSGNWAYRLIDKGHRVTLVDFSIKMLQLAKKRLSSCDDSLFANFVCADISYPSFRAGVWDIFLAVGDVLSYVEHPLQVLNNLAGLAPTANILIGTVISKFGLAAKQLINENYAAWGRLIENGKFVERNRDELLESSIKQKLDHPIYPLELRAFSAKELSLLLEAASMEVLTISGINVIPSITGQYKFNKNILGIERVISNEEVWRDFSTNLFFVAKWKSK